MEENKNTPQQPLDEGLQDDLLQATQPLEVPTGAPEPEEMLEGQMELPMDAPTEDPLKDDSWLDELLGIRQTVEEIGPDEHAVSAAGLTHPDDAELEKILAEHWDEEPQPEQEPVGDQTVRFTPQEPRNQDVMVYDAEEDLEVHPEEEPQKEIPKTRPKMKKGYGFFGIPHLVVTAIWLAIILLIGVTLGQMLWSWCADLMAFGKPDRSVTITITDEEVGDIDAITKKLADAGLIDQPEVFKFFASFTGKAEDISAGTFTLNAALDYNAMIKHMMPQSPSREIVEDLLIPEGYNCAQIFALLEDKGICTVAELEEYAANGELDDYWFLEGVQRGDKYCLEGYLFPDTYDFYTNDDPERVLEKMLDAFDYRFTAKMREDFATMQTRFADMLAKNGYGQDYIASHTLTLHQVITMASIVQKEMATNAESYTISSVFYNRLANAAQHPYLGSDATTYYAIGDYFGEKKELSQEDIAFDSPYNTRNHQGLPPGAICNPGVYAIYAALDPDDSSYYYFIYDRQLGEHRFTKTLAEHEKLAEELGY